MRLFLAVAASLITTPAQAADALEPAAKWVVDFDDAQCVATRNYGTAENPIYLVLKAPPLGSVLQIGIIRRGSGSDAQQIDGELTFDQNAPLRTNLLQYGVQKLKQQAILVNVPLQDLTPMRHATTVRIHAREDRRKIGSRVNLGARGADVTFALTQMGSLLGIMDSCVADLKKVWNVKEDAAVSGGDATGSLAGIFSSEDYPAVALDKDQTGVVAFALLIDEQGKVADCTVIATSGAASLDAKSCGIIKVRAKFSPARGPNGQPIKSAFTGRVRWLIPY
jgi:TonB family protein